MHRQVRPVCLFALLLAVFLLSAASCGGAAEGLGRLTSASDDAGRLIAREVDASELTGLSSRLDDIAEDVSRSGSLTDEERAVLDRAAQRAALLKEIVGMFPVADEVKGLISTDAVKLLDGSFLYGLHPTAAFKAKMEEAALAILKETTCSAFANEMNASSKVTPSPGLPLPRTATPPSVGGVYADLTKAVSDAGYYIAEVQDVVNLQGLSSNILSAADKYVSKVKKSMTAFTWANGGAIQAYLRVCVR